MPTWRGQFRVRGGEDGPHPAWTSDGDLGDWMDKDDYLKAVHLSPPWNELPWRGEEEPGR